MAERETYTVKTPFPVRGRILGAGEQVSLHPRQAKYLLGTHLERPMPAGKGGAARKGKQDGGNS